MALGPNLEFRLRQEIRFHLGWAAQVRHDFLLDKSQTPQKTIVIFLRERARIAQLVIKTRVFY